MRTSFSVALMAGVILLGAPWAGAQPAQWAPPPVNRPAPVVRVGAPEKLLTDDVTEFFNVLNGPLMIGEMFWEVQRRVEVVKQGYFGATEWSRDWWWQQAGLLKLDDTKIVAIGGKQATVQLKYTLGPPENQHSYTTQFVLHWRDDPGEEGPLWKFVSVEPDQKVPALSDPLHWAVYMLAQPPGAIEKYRSVLPASSSAQSKLHQLAQSFQQLIQGYDGRFAFRAELAEEAVAPYLNFPAFWIVPDLPEHFRFNAHLCDHNEAEVKDPARTVMLYDGSDEKPVLRYGGKAAICFVDGHVALVSEAELAGLVWKL